MRKVTLYFNHSFDAVCKNQKLLSTNDHMPLFLKQIKPARNVMLKKLKSLKLPEFNLSQSIKLPKFSRSSESTAFSDLDLSESPQPTESVKSFSFDRKKAAKAASSVVLFGFSGWILWNTFLVEPEFTLPPSALPAVASINPASLDQPLTPVEPIETIEPLAIIDPDLMIDELLVATSEDIQTDDMPDQWMQDIQHSTDTTHDPDTLIKAEQSMAEVFELRYMKNLVLTRYLPKQ